MHAFNACAGSAPIGAAAHAEPAGESLTVQIVNAALFGVGEILLGSALVGVTLLVVSAAAAFPIARNLDRESASEARVAS